MYKQTNSFVAKKNVNVGKNRYKTIRQHSEYKIILKTEKCVDVRLYRMIKPLFCYTYKTAQFSSLVFHKYLDIYMYTCWPNPQFVFLCFS